MSLSRREFLHFSAAVPAVWAGASLHAHEEDPRFPGLIVRNSEPKNLEFPFASLRDRITPNEQFFVRGHFPIPKLVTADYTLAIEGAGVRQKRSFTYEAILKLPSTEVTATLECAGNGRVFLKPALPGLQWGLGAVSTAKWKGVSLATVLDAVGLKEGAVEVLLEGHDRGQINTDPKSPGPINFDRSIPLAKALAKETILAYEMNGKPLPGDHGGPLRAIVPGWYGMCSVKWLKRLVVVDKPYRGFWQSLDYSYFERTEGSPTLVPLSEMLVKASIARPALGEVVPAGKKTTIFGAAWAGESKIKKVEVSSDGGKTWADAKLLHPTEKYVWSFWQYEWQTPAKPGPAQLMARATDDKGQTQPVERDPDRRSYAINHLVPVEVEVR